MRKKLMVILVAAIALTALGQPASAAVDVGNTAGCGRGFWKNHLDWPTIIGEPITPSMTLGSLGWDFPDSLAAYESMTLVEALEAKGDTRLEGAVQKLIRAAATSWLNAAVEIPFPYRRTSVGFGGLPPLLTLINDALNSGDRATIVSLASELDAANSLGCPL